MVVYILDWLFTLLYVIVTAGSTGLLSVMLYVIYGRYKKLQRKLKEVEIKLATSQPSSSRVVSEPRKKRLTDSDIKLILELHRQGYSYRQIAKIVGISHTAVGRIVKKYASLLEIMDVATDVPEDLVEKNEKEEALVA
jgi:transposase